MAIQTFTPPPEALVGAIRGGFYGQPVQADPTSFGPALKGAIYDQNAQPTGATGTTFGQPVAPAPAGGALGAPGGEMQFNSPWQSKYAEHLLADGGDTKTPIKHWAEGVGRLSMLASGHYLKGKDEDQRADREKSTMTYIEKNLPEYADSYRMGSAEERAQIAQVARQTILARAEEGRKRAQSNADYAPVIEAMKNGASAEEVRRISLSNPSLAPKAAQSYMDSAEEEAKFVKTQSRLGAQKKADYDEKYSRFLKLYDGDTKRAEAAALGVNPETLNTPVGNDPYVSAYEVVTDPKDRAQAMIASRTLHTKNSEEIRKTMVGATAQVRALSTAQDLINNPNLYTGAGFDQVTFLKKVATSLGMKVEGVSQAELLSSLGNTLAKGAREGFPGAVSNFEYQTYLKSVVSGRNTREGNQAILNYLNESAKLQASIAEDVAAFKEMKRSANPRSAAYLDESFQSFHFDRQQERVTKLAEMKAQVDRVVGASANGGGATREQRLLDQQKWRGGQSAPQGAAQAAPTPPAPASGGVADGTIAEDSSGNRLVRQGGKWVPAQ